MSEPHDLKEFLENKKQQFYDRRRDTRFLIQALGRCMHDLAKQTDADVNWVFDDIMAEIDKKLKKKLELMDIGGLTALLIGHGSSGEQAREAVAQWYGISEKKVRDALNMVLDDFSITDKKNILENRDLRMTYIYSPMVAKTELKKDFPEDYPAAQVAYKKAVLAANAYANSGPASFDE